MGEMRYLSEEGDTKLIWDPEKEDEVEAAEEMFDKLIDKGYKAFSVKKDGATGKEIKKFDADAGKIIMVPKLVGG
jgi:hypothetical protein